METFELENMLNASLPGDYAIEAWIATSSFDPVHTNDTLRTIYRNTKIALPFDNDFSTSDLSSLTVKSILRDSVWNIVDTAANHDFIIEPYYGTGMLIFRGEIGTISSISTGQLELNRTQQPVLEFWYAHDNSNPEREDQLDVRLTFDGGTSYKTLFNIMRYDSTTTSPTWRKYLVDLSQYQDSSCVIISFDGYSYGGSQYIDRIAISSNHDLSVSEFVISPYSACSLEEKELKVIFTNETGQNIDFDKAENNTDLIIEVTYEGNLISTNTYPLTGLLEGLASDSITDTQKINLAKGTYILTSYLSKSIDNTPQNDIHRDTIVIDPKIEIELHQVSASNACLGAKSSVWQEVILTNTGNMDLFDIKLVLQIDTGETGSPAYDTITETCHGTIPVDSSVTYSFINPYTVPWNEDYYPRIFAYSVCDPALVNATTAIVECVDIKDLSIVSIDNLDTGKDTIGKAIQVTATLHNRNNLEAFTNARITVLVTNSQGIQTDTFTETKTVGILATESHTFTQSYTVPNDSVYYLIVYTDKYDNYSYNDTIITKRYTINTGTGITKPTGIVKDFTLNQNIPNPANNSTLINYSVPEAGEVIFHIHSISGQLLYSKTIEASSGNQSIELNTSMFTAGIYFYSITYKDQRLVKRMSIK
jgi:hypothetical protein